MRVRDLFEQRVRGFRVVEVASFALLVTLVLWVYVTKAGAARQRLEIARLEQRITEEERRVKGLRAETAHLEQPARLEALSASYLLLRPVRAEQEARPDRLNDLARDPGARLPASRAVGAEGRTAASRSVNGQ